MRFAVAFRGVARVTVTAASGSSVSISSTEYDRPASASGAICRHTSDAARAYSIACGSEAYFLLFVYPAFAARAVDHVSSITWLEPRRRPATVTCASDFDTVHTS